MRPGEKLHEEWMSGQENLLATHHPKILRAARAEVDREAVRMTLEEAQHAMEKHNWNTDDVRVAFARHLPEYSPFITEHSSS